MWILSKQTIVVVLGILLICVFRFSYFYETYADDVGVVIDPDTKGYVNIATNILEKGKYQRSPGLPEIHRPPGYPLFLVLNFALFGQDNLLATVIFQHVLFFLMLLMVGYLAFQMGGVIALAIAVGLYALDFTTFYYTNEILSEVLFSFFIILAVFVFNLGMSSNSRWKHLFFLTGVTVTVGIFVRPVGMYLMYPLTIFVGVAAYLDSEDIGHSVKSALLFFLPWMLMGGAWYYYSYSVSGNWTFTYYEIAGVYTQRIVAVIKSSLAVDFETAFRIAYERQSTTGSQFKTFFLIMFEHPWAAGKELMLDLGRLLFSPAQGHLKPYFPNVFGNQFSIENLLFQGEFREIVLHLKIRPIMYLPIIILVILHLLVSYLGVLLSIRGIRRLSFENRVLYVIMILFIGYFLAITIVFIGHARFRIPFMPLLAILSGYGFSLMFNKKKLSLN